MGTFEERAVATNERSIELLAASFILSAREDWILSTAKPPLNRLKKLWQEGRPTFGAIATIPSIQTVQIMARSGLDWIIVDLEHGPIDLGSAHAMITATSGTPCVPMVR